MAGGVVSTQLVKAVDSHSPDSDGDLTHYYCCDENRAFCGADLTDAPFVESADDALCIVCEDLDDFICEVSGCSK